MGELRSTKEELGGIKQELEPRIDVGMPQGKVRKHKNKLGAQVEFTNTRKNKLGNTCKTLELKVLKHKEEHKLELGRLRKS
jgi:hypothetical protein